MKIPDGIYLSPEAEKAWEHAAAQIGIELGIYIAVGKNYDSGALSRGFMRLNRIYFKFGGHEFDTLTELRKALELKAFI